MSYQLVSRSGNHSAFADMVAHCREHEVDVYVDVVLNHMAGGSVGDPVQHGRAGTAWQYRCPRPCHFTPCLDKYLPEGLHCQGVPQ